MRRLRLFVACILAGAGALVLPASQASSAPTAPYDAFVLDYGATHYVLDPSNADFFLNPYAENEDQLMVTPKGACCPLTTRIAPPTGQTWSVGTFTTRLVADATRAGFWPPVQIVGSCSEMLGSMTIHEVHVIPGTKHVDVLALTYEAPHCPGDTGPKGEVRWHSSVGYTAAGQTAADLSFGLADIDATTPAQTVTLVSGGSNTLNLGQATITGANAGLFSISADTCSNTSRTYPGPACSISVTAHPTASGAFSATLVIPDNTAAGQRSVGLSGVANPSAEGTYRPVTPERLLDTRTGNGAPTGPLGAGGTLQLQVTGRGLVPASGVSAVVLNVTATEPTAASYLTVYPAGVARPTASNLNFTPGWTGANFVTIAVGTGGIVDIYNNAGNVHVIADVVGYYAGAQSGLAVAGQFVRTTPQRLLDTRAPDFGGPLLDGDWVVLGVDYGAAANPHIKALAVNVTAVDPTAPGYLTTWNGQGSVPNTSTLNFVPHTIVPNLAVVPVAPCANNLICAGLPAIGIYNGSGGSTHVVVDIFGFYDDATLAGGLRFQPITPTRIVDTRTGLGVPGALGQGATATVTTPGAIAGSSTQALALNVTAVAPSAATYLSVWPAGAGSVQPTVSNLNPAAGQIVPNGVYAGIGPSKQFNVYNNAGTLHLVVDVCGTFVTPASSPSVQGIRATSPAPPPVYTATGTSANRRR